MKREEQINNQAKIYSEDDDFDFGYNKELYKAFRDGAKWADQHPYLPALWHEASEKPKDRSNILVRYTYLGCAELKSHRINYNHLPSWSEFVDFNEIEEWAYVSDILPKGGKK